MRSLLSVPVQKMKRFSIWPRFDSAYKVRGFEVSEMAYFVIARERIPRN